MNTFYAPEVVVTGQSIIRDGFLILRILVRDGQTWHLVFGIN